MIFAYIDPATGAMVLQILAAAVLAAGVFFRRVLMAPFAFLFRKQASDDTSSANGEGADST